MSTPEIIKKLKKKNPNLTASQLKSVLEVFVEAITKSLIKKNAIEIRSFGTFFLKEIKEKKSARNPKTGELIYVPKKNKIRFKASKRLKAFINKKK